MRSLLFRLFSTVLVFSTLIYGHSASADDRALVEMPAPMQAHMLSNMRSHLRALDKILGLLAAGDVSAAGTIAENQLGLASLDDHGAAHLATLMPPAMQAFGTEMHKAASRFAQTAQDADIERTFEAQQNVFAALQDITAQCNACHANYRIR